MRFFGWLRRASFEQGAPAAAPQRRGWLGGRRMLAGTLYVMPKDRVEGDRLDLQHHLYKLLLGRNAFARLRQPRALLDVACGTGIWCREMALEYPRAQVVGFDIDRTPLETSLARLGPGGQFPANFQFLEADALQRFPFAEEQFDYSHARAVSPFVPIARWPALVAEMVRVTRVGGYVELVDFDMGQAISRSQSFTTLWSALQEMMQARGLHTGAGPHLAGYLRQAGLVHVQERQAVAGRGPQATRQQRLLVADLLSILTNVQPLLVRMGAMSEASYQERLDLARSELRQWGVTQPVTFACGQRL
jgi:ubiquinone/menaquinone biosynthesis C-methylase UbiE